MYYMHSQVVQVLLLYCQCFTTWKLSFNMTTPLHLVFEAHSLFQCKFHWSCDVCSKQCILKLFKVLLPYCAMQILEFKPWHCIFQAHKVFFTANAQGPVLFEDPLIITESLILDQPQSKYLILTLWWKNPFTYRPYNFALGILAQYFP